MSLLCVLVIDSIICFSARSNSGLRLSGSPAEKVGPANLELPEYSFIFIASFNALPAGC